MDKVTASFENSTVYVGLDVHKRSWNAGIFLDSMYVRNVHQPPSPAALSNYLKTIIPVQIINALTKAENLDFGYSASYPLTVLNAWL